MLFIVPTSQWESDRAELWPFQERPGNADRGTGGRGEQSDSFCGLLIIERLLMARTSPQRLRSASSTGGCSKALARAYVSTVNFLPLYA